MEYPPSTSCTSLAGVLKELPPMSDKLGGVLTGSNDMIMTKLLIPVHQLDPGSGNNLPCMGGKLEAFSTQSGDCRLPNEPLVSTCPATMYFSRPVDMSYAVQTTASAGTPSTQQHWTPFQPGPSSVSNIIANAQLSLDETQSSIHPHQVSGCQIMPTGMPSSGALHSPDKTMDGSKGSGGSEGPMAGGKYECKYCDRTYDNRFSRRRHERSHEGKEGPCVKCQVCAKDFRPEYIQRHLREVHGSKSFSCQYCKRSFSRSSSLRRHEDLHALPPFRDPGSEQQILQRLNLFPCSHCGQCFKHRYARNRHERYHKTTSLTACPVCGKMYREEYFEKHVREVHGEKEFKCEFCQKLFSRQTSLNSHIQRCHSRETAQAVPQVACPVCLKEFSVHNVKRHIMQVHGRAQECMCNQCGVSCASKASLKRHMALHESETRHPSARKVTCQYCNSIMRADYYAKHMRSVHAEGRERVSRPPSEKPPVKRTNTVRFCEQCGLKFSSVFSLKRHTLARHNVNSGEQQKPVIRQANTAVVPSVPPPAVSEIAVAPPPRQSCGGCLGSLRKDYLSKHVRIKHECQHGLQCNYCTGHFPDDEALRQHELWHLTKDIDCPPCTGDPGVCSQPCMPLHPDTAEDLIGLNLAAVLHESNPNKAEVVTSNCPMVCEDVGHYGIAQATFTVLSPSPVNAQSPSVQQIVSGQAVDALISGVIAEGQLRSLSTTIPSTTV